MQTATALVSALVSALALAVLAACQSIPEIKLAPGTGAVTGTLTSAPHKDLMAKATSEANAMSTGSYVHADATGRIYYDEKMINYEILDELYAGLIVPGRRQPVSHAMSAGGGGLSPRSVALAKGDRLRLTNATKDVLTFFVTDTGGGIVEFAPLGPGASGEAVIDLEGPLEIGADERANMTGSLLSRPGLAVRVVKSGGRYVFKDLAPGTYDMVFWYWRLGSLERRAKVTPGTIVEINEKLSVDRTVH